MVSKITIFEPHFDGAQFGPSSIGESDVDMDSSDETVVASSGWGVPWRKLLAGTVLAGLVLGMFAMRRFQKGRDSAVDAPGQSIDEAGIEEAVVE